LSSSSSATRTEPARIDVHPGPTRVRRAPVAPPVGPAVVDTGSAARRDQALFAQYSNRRDPTDRELLVKRYLPLARQLARRYQRDEASFDDLFQVACLGLLKAIDRFDPERGVAFSTYAVPTIAGEIKRHFRDRTWSVRVPRDLQELALKVERTASELALGLGRQPTVAEIADAIGLSDEDVLEALEAARAYEASSLQSPLGDPDRGDTLGESIGVEDPGFAGAEQRATLEQLMSALTAREREVLRLRFAEDLTQSEIGERVGVSQMHVSRIIRHALAQLRAVASTPNDARQGVQLLRARSAARQLELAA
jgi:RNA polymerase sigma-B factor